MSKFVKKNIESVWGKQKFSQLVILPNDADVAKIDLNAVDGVWDLYEKGVEEKYKGSVRGLTALMQRKANIQSLAREKFRDITPKKEAIKEYEFKYQDLRAYGIKLPDEVLILLGGYKNQQDDDEIAFRALKKQYLESIKTGK